VVAQLLGALGLAAGGTAGALLAERLTGGVRSAGLPLAVLVLGSGVAAVAVAHVTDRAGRRVALAAAHLGGAAGAVLAVIAASVRSWPLLLVGCALLGGGNAAVMLARYAAADVGGGGRAIGTVVSAASVGAIAGPNLLGPAGAVARRVGLPDAAGLFLLAGPAFLGAALVLLVFFRPDPTAGVDRSARSRARPRPGAAFRERHLRLPLLVLALTNFTMVAVMAVVPAHLVAGHTTVGGVGVIVSAHIAAMFLPSPLTGRLVDRIGAPAVAGLGAGLSLAAAGLAALAGHDRTAVVAALLLLGAGWNAGLIGGSAMLRAAPVDASVRTRAEGLGELAMGLAAAVGSAAAGAVLAAGGFGLLGVAVAVPATIVLTLVRPLGRNNVAHAHRSSRRPRSGRGRRLVHDGARRHGAQPHPAPGRQHPVDRTGDR